MGRQAEGATDGKTGTVADGDALTEVPGEGLANGRPSPPKYPGGGGYDGRTMAVITTRLPPKSNRVEKPAVNSTRPSPKYPGEGAPAGGRWRIRERRTHRSTG